VLSDPTGGYQIGRGVGTGTLLDNDTNGGGLTIGIGDSSVVNAQSGKQNVTVPVVLSGPAPGPLTVSYTVTPQSAEYSAKVTGGGNFGGKLAGTIKFAAGARFKNVNIPIWARPNLGTDKTFTITLTGVTGGDVAITRATGSQTIVGGF
jgi:hypothetical protein